MSETPSTPNPSEQPKPGEPAAAPAPAPAAAPVPAAAQVSVPTPDAGTIPDPADVEKNKVFALLAYIGLLFLVPLLAAKDSPFAKYHANQGIILFIASLAMCIVVGFVCAIISFIPFVQCLTCVCAPLPMIAILAYTIIGILNAVNGKMKPLPGVPATLKIIK